MNLTYPKLRPAKPEDLAEIQQLYIDTISTICKKDYNENQIQAWISGIENKQRWIDALIKQHFVVAELNDEIIGYASLADGCHIDLFYVHKNYQRQGIANQLLQELEKEAIKLQINILTSNVSKTAKPFFEKNGFKVVLEQVNNIKGVEIMNYRMIKELA
ncbi:GNAT family N-acetyltransferase [Rubrolithibacter danxiaensis]|uniref:GNAT family N-acetyltransferase n=1 Tax=Rubrolithibacter danxiaensis TaxID=3390805 RepID=UPI003BF812B0